MAVDKYIILLCAFSCLCRGACELQLSEGSPCVTKGYKGTCVSIYRCMTAAVTYLYGNAGFNIKAYHLPELPDICSYKNNEPVVCCTDCNISDKEFRGHPIEPSGRIANKNDSISKTKCQDYFQSLPYPCRDEGIVVVEKIWDEEKQCHQYTIDIKLAVGGQDALRWEFPHVALLGYGKDVETAQWLCGGSVISERFILTAAHCTSTVALGNITYAALGLLKRSDPKKYWKIYNIKRIILHPDYKSPSKYHDIALLETETEINFGIDLLPACLDSESIYKTSAKVPGWGRLGHRKRLADNLQIVQLNEYNKTECSKIYQTHRHLKRGYDHEKQMCYGNHEEIVDTCEGDSGGPLQTADTNGVKCLYTIVGVTSYGKDCGFPGSAGMYTRVSYYVPWIESVVWPEETKARNKSGDQWPAIDRLIFWVLQFLRALFI